MCVLVSGRTHLAAATADIGRVISKLPNHTAHIMVWTELNTEKYTNLVKEEPEKGKKV